MSLEPSMVSYYAERAREYERIYQKPERQTDLATLSRLIERTFAGADVLELACGTGYWTAILARSAASVLATDINEEVLGIAHSKGLDAARIRFQREDAYALPLLSQRFTAGFGAFWWSHVPKRTIGDFLRGFHRVLAPGARVVFIDNAYVKGSSTPISRVDGHGDTYQVRRLEDGSTHEVRKNFPSEPELHAALDSLASDVSVDFLQHYWVLSYVLAGTEGR